MKNKSLNLKDSNCFEVEFESFIRFLKSTNQKYTRTVKVHNKNVFEKMWQDKKDLYPVNKKATVVQSVDQAI